MKTISSLLLIFSFLLVAIVTAQEAESQDVGKSKGEFITRMYEVPVTFLSMLSSNLRGDQSASDPFAEPAETDLPQPRRGVRAYLESFGMHFGEGASVTYNPGNSSLIVRNTADQLELLELILDEMRSSGEKQIHIYLEYIEVEQSDFSDWLFENVMQSDGTKLRNEVQEWIKGGRAEIIDSATLISRSGQRAKVESIDEFIYPTEYDPAEIPNEVTLKDGAEAPVTPVTPTAFETRNLGLTFEVDPVLGSDDYTIDLNLAPEKIELEGIEQWHHKLEDPKFKTHMPTFYSMRITTQITTHDGRYSFIGTTRPLNGADPKRENPIILQFVRGDIASSANWSEVEVEEEE